MKYKKIPLSISQYKFINFFSFNKKLLRLFKVCRQIKIELILLNKRTTKHKNQVAVSITVFHKNLCVILTWIGVGEEVNCPGFDGDFIEFF